MKQRRRIYYSAAQRSEIRDRWQAGEPMSSIAGLGRSTEEERRRRHASGRRRHGWHGLLSQPFRAGSNQKGPAAMPGRSLGAQDQSSFEVACIRRLVELGLKVVKGDEPSRCQARDYSGMAFASEGAATNGRTGRAIRDADKRQIQILQRER
jgi:hypothetical protein